MSEVSSITGDRRRKTRLGFFASDLFIRSVATLRYQDYASISCFFVLGIWYPCRVSVMTLRILPIKVTREKNGFEVSSRSRTRRWLTSLVDWWRKMDDQNGTSRGQIYSPLLGLAWSLPSWSRWPDHRICLHLLPPPEWVRIYRRSYCRYLPLY